MFLRHDKKRSGLNCAREELANCCHSSNEYVSYNNKNDHVRRPFFRRSAMRGLSCEAGGGGVRSFVRLFATAWQSCDCDNHTKTKNVPYTDCYQVYSNNVPGTYELFFSGSCRSCIYVRRSPCLGTSSSLNWHYYYSAGCKRLRRTYNKFVPEVQPGTTSTATTEYTGTM